MREAKMNDAIKKVQEKILHDKDMFMSEVKQIQRGEVTETFVYMSQDRTWTSNVICHGVFGIQ
jgi:hypothetical protein